MSNPNVVRAAAFVRNGAPHLLVLAAILVLHPLGLAGELPVWLVAIPLLVSTVWTQPRVQRRISGGDPHRRLWVRVPVAIFATTATMYLIGWGALLAVAHLHILSVYLQTSGSRAWKPAAVSGVASLAVGQLLVAVGAVPSYLGGFRSHGLALLVAIGIATTARTLGRLVAQREQVEIDAKLSEDRFRALVRDGSEVITLSDAAGDVSWVSPAARPVMGYQPEELRGKVLRGLFHPEDTAASVELFTRLLASDSTVEHSAELRVRHANGSWQWHEIIARNMLAHPAVHAIVSHHRDITGRRVTSDGKAYAASHDGLTGLANGPTLERDLERALAHGTRYQYPVALICCDLDGFKAVNDTYGHDVGDRLLQTVGQIIKRTTRETDTVARLGNDEYGVLLTRIRDAGEAMHVARRIVEGIEAHASVAGLRFDVGVSLGVALAYPGGTDAKTLLLHGDTAMYRSKRRGRNNVTVYTQDEVTAPWM
ncbi:diguanylate cyclase domain-containing protein [Actinoplanes sp. NPDC051859]|uniref:diguanylate cyclase domain-containing protein n=1 Tax=Actinoplanes sp. NPDC051859 TaxID=3363909 RepID=UPI0037ACEB1C